MASGCQLLAAMAFNTGSASPGSTIRQRPASSFKTADKKPVKNVDLWQRLDAALGQHQIKWEWVKGHAGDPGNERADELANMGAAQFAE